MNWFIFGLTLDTLGKVLLGVAVLMVHRRILQEHKIDRAVLKTMKKEWILTLFSIGLIVAGYTMQIISFA